ncbi:MAG: hypothetical protein C5B52_01280 [Bacteroidetes bacterium]|nr:MAG: hypothetical protein C5B52_01280 [Bacteroidota bacterium]
MRSKLILLCTALLCLIAAFGYSQRYPIVHYSPREGLINNRVKGIYQDSKGKLYFGTSSGLSIYDGTRFWNYTHENGLAQDLVNDFLEMGNDSVWIACNTSGLNYITGNKIYTYRTSDGFYPVINKFLKSSDSNLYILSDDGLFFFSTNKFTKLPFIDENGKDVGRFLYEGVEWNNYFIILTDPHLTGMPSKLFVYDRVKQKIISEEKNMVVYAAGKSPWLGLVISTNKGMFSIDTAQLKNLKLQYKKLPDAFQSPRPNVSLLYTDREKNFWIGTGDRLIIRLDSLGNRKEFTTSNGLNSGNFSSILEDQEGSVWITFIGGGIDKMVNRNISFYEQFDNRKARSIYTDQSMDSCYVFLEDGSIITIPSDESGKQTILSTDKAIPGTFAAVNHTIILGDAYHVYYLKKSRLKGEFRLAYSDSLEDSFGNIFPDPNGNYLLAGTGYITAVTGGGKKVFRYPTRQFADYLYIDSTNKVWVPLRDDRLLLLKINPDNPSNYLELVRNYTRTMQAKGPRSITVGADGALWIGTRFNGLFRADFDSSMNIKRWKQFTTRDGLSDNFILHLSADKQNNIWVSTSGGLDRIKNVNGQFKIENLSKSVNIFESVIKTMVDRNGVGWSYTGEGKVIRVGKSVDFPGPIPSMIVTELKVGDIEMDPTQKEYSFSYKENNFNIAVAAISFYYEKQIKYSYLLEGSSNQNWSEPSNNSNFNFINLLPGNYKLIVKAIYPAGRYPDQFLNFKFVVHPPWWQTWWFRALAVIAIISLVFFLVRSFFTRKLELQRINLEQQKAIEKERTRIATDMHDDLGAGLSRIKFLSESMKLRKTDDSTLKQELEKITNYSVEMVEKMGEIVWALNEKNDTIADLIAFTRSYATDYLSNNGVECVVHAPDELPQKYIDGEKRRNIFLAVKECLHNVVKHASATKVDFRIYINNHLEMEIQDNGKGIDLTQKRRFSNGIDNIKSRMASLHGNASFENHNGTRVLLTIPL